MATPSWADDDTEGDADSEQMSEPDEDIALGELGTTEDDGSVPSGGRRARGQPRPAPPRVVFNPSARIALAHRFSPDLSAELFARGMDGAVSDPITSRTSRVSAGAILNRRIGPLVWSNSIEVSQHYRDFYARPTFDTTELTTALARHIKLDAAWSISPRVSFGYQWASEARQERTKIELMAPLAYKVDDKLSLIFTPRVDWQDYARNTQRRDLTGYVAGGVKYDITKSMSVAASIGYESRSSTLARANFSRWKLAPQMNLRHEF